MPTRTSSLNNLATLVYTADNQDMYSAVDSVFKNIDKIQLVASLDLTSLSNSIDQLKDFTGITVVLGDTPSWNATTKTLTVPRGQKGDPGLKGDPGERGEQGLPGIPGAVGTRGSEGKEGPRGLMGLQGPQGLRGIQGEQGLRGEQGLPGADGKSIQFSSITPTSDGSFIWKFSDGSTYTTPRLKGEQGEQGIAGESLSVQVEYYGSGKFSWNFSDGSSYATPDLRGTPGVKGEQGTSVHHLRPTSTTNSYHHYHEPGAVDTYTFYGDMDEHINLGHFSVYNGDDLYSWALKKGYIGTEENLYAMLTALSNYYDQIVANANRAEDARDAAGVSEANALASEQNARVSELNALQSEQNAKVSEDAAKVSETNAATSELNAANAMNAAYVSEVNALASEQAAKLSEDNAKVSEINSATSASNALVSEQVAKAAEIAAMNYLTAVEQVFDNFDDIYLGAKSDDPAVDNDGDPLVPGQVYWNTTEEEVRFYNGSVWERPEYSASQSALNAYNSALAASTSEINAKTSELAAKQSELNALQSETNASTSATNAGVSEQNALISEQHALASEQSAIVSAQNALTSEQAALVSETSAKVSELAAKQSETNASASEANALVSEQHALVSELAAKASENASKLSETNASTSEVNAANSASSALISSTASALSEANALQSANNADVSEYNADVSAANALVSEQNAKSSETNALASEQAAATSATSAESSNQSAIAGAAVSEASSVISVNSASIATTKASEAAASASNALVSEQNAAASETSASNSALTATTSLASIQSIEHSFNQVYLGGYGTEPVLDNNGDPLVEGSVFWDNSINKLKVYNGTTWIEAVIPASEMVTLVDTQTLNNKTIDDITNTVGADHIHYPVRNNTGTTMTKGTIVKASGTQPGTDYMLVEVVTDPTIEVALGILDQDLLNNEVGTVVNTGVVTGVSTNGWDEGTILYVGSNGFTPIKPTIGMYQAAAVVTRKHNAHGTMLVEFSEPVFIASTTQYGYVQLVDDLTAGGSDKALTAEQGKVLQQSIGTILDFQSSLDAALL